MGGGGGSLSGESLMCSKTFIVDVWGMGGKQQTDNNLNYACLSLVKSWRGGGGDGDEDEDGDGDELHSHSLSSSPGTNLERGKRGVGEPGPPRALYLTVFTVLQLPLFSSVNSSGCGGSCLAQATAENPLGNAQIMHVYSQNSLLPCLAAYEASCMVITLTG